MSQPSRKRVFKIEPFRHKVELDPRYAEKTWKVIEDAINEIYNHNASGLSFEELYRNAYNMVLHKYGDTLYSGLVNVMKKNLQKVASVVEESQGDMFLLELNAKWGDHNKSLQMIRDILMYMDRTYVTNSGKTPVYELGLNLWHEHVVKAPKIKDRLVKNLLELIHKERNGESVNRSVLRSLVSMFTELGSVVYLQEFEIPFIKATSDFYDQEAQQLLEGLRCPEYFKQTERRVKEELDRVSHYIDKVTERSLTLLVHNTMLGKHVRTLVEEPSSGLIAMMESASYEDLGRMYLLLRKVQEGHPTMLEVMSAHLRAVGKKIVTDSEKIANPLEFVQALLDEKDKYDRLVKRGFHEDKSFQNAVGSAFEYFLNLNRRSPEYISLFVDDKLRRGLKGSSEEETEATLDKVVMLFRFLEEKDVFEKYYKQHLAKRLLLGRTVSDDAERSLILKLKTECGYQFTSKLEGMFNDMKTSREATEAFFKAMAEAEVVFEGPLLTVQILTTGYWPIQSGAACNLPPELYPVCDRFKQHYLENHTGRRLTWQTSMGNADVRAHFNSRKYELSVSTYQMCVLMLFNSSERLSYKDIELATDIPAADLKRSLQSLALVKGKNVLRKDPATKEVAEEDVFHVNESFQSKLVKIKILTVVAQKETEPEKQETREKVEEDRKPQIEAAIVRIMKARRVLDHNNIISEVTTQLQSRFLPNPAVIKKRIESLIEREFLERDKVDRKLYRYLA